VESHLAGCADCQAEADRLAAASARASQWLGYADPPAVPAEERGAVRAIRPGLDGPVRVGRRGRAPARPAWWSWGSPVLRAAAVLALVAGAAVAVPSALRWLADSGDSPATVSDPREPAPGAPGTVAGNDGLSVSFVPAGNRLVVRLAVAQAAGRVALEPVAGREVHAEVMDGSGVEELVVLPDGLSVRNAAASTASYRIRVPGQITRLELVVGDRPVWSGSASALPREVPAADD
jgi:hypothetical protein